MRSNFFFLHAFLNLKHHRVLIIHICLTMPNPEEELIKSSIKINRCNSITGRARFTLPVAFMTSYIHNFDFYQIPDWMHRSFYCPDAPEQSGDFRRISDNAQFHADAGNELDHKLQDLLQAWEYCHRSYGLFALGRPCKYNIYKNIEGKADIPPFQCINSDVQKWASIFLP